MTAAAPLRWVILNRIARVPLDDEQHPPHIYVPLTAPPSLTTLSVHTDMHPNPEDHDRLPYVVAADTAVLLLHIKRQPMVVTDRFNPRGIFFVVRVRYLPVHGNVLGNPIGSVIRLPNCVYWPAMPPITHLKHVGLVSVPGSSDADYIVAELKVFFQNERARLVYFRSGTPAWAEKELPLPLADMPCEILLFHEVVSHDRKLWWVNLRQGILSCDPFDDQPELRYTHLPVAIPIENQHPFPDIEKNRLVRMSNGFLRYVEIVRAVNDPLEATTVVMWSLEDNLGGGFMWSPPVFQTRIEDIWASRHYMATGMPEEVPMLAAVHPSNPDVIYFFLRHFLFGVDMRHRSVVHCVDEGYDLGRVFSNGSQMLPPISWRYALAWVLRP